MGSSSSTPAPSATNSSSTPAPSTTNSKKNTTPPQPSSNTIVVPPDATRSQSGGKSRKRRHSRLKRKHTKKTYRNK